MRHPNRPHKQAAPKHSWRHRCFCKPNKTGGDNMFTKREQAIRKEAA